MDEVLKYLTQATEALKTAGQVYDQLKGAGAISKEDQETLKQRLKEAQVEYDQTFNRVQAKLRG